MLVLVLVQLVVQVVVVLVMVDVTAIRVHRVPVPEEVALWVYVFQRFDL